MIRVHKLSFESHLKTKLPCAHLLMAWLVEHCADVLNRYNIGADGRTPYQRLKGRKFVGHMLEFGISVMFRVSGKVHGGVMQERWFLGIWLGKKLHTEEHLVMKEDGLVVRSKAARENSQPLVMEDYDKLISTPHDPTGTVKAATTRCCPISTPRSKSWGRTHHDEPRSRRTSSISSGRRRGARSAEPSRRERIEDMMKANPDFRERVDRADVRINKMLVEYLAKKDREANKETQSAKRPRIEASGTATGSRDPLPQKETERDAEMGVPEAGAHGEIAGSSKRSLETEEGTERLAHFDTGHRGQVIGELHWRESSSRIKRGC